MFSRVRGFFSAHPLFFLILLSPQVEYLTGSSQLSWSVGNPILFVLFLVQNLGSYGLAVVLIREAQIRWNKGWASILLLGAAYGILNEGIGAATLFNPDGSNSGPIGSYGRWLGVNWVWATGLVLLVHPLVSVSLPILQHRLAFPTIKGKRLIGDRGLRLAVVGLGINAIATLLFVGTIRHYFAGPILWAASCAMMVTVVGAARTLPRNLLQPRTALPRARLVSFFLLGTGFIWTVMLGGDVLVQLDVYPLLVSLFFVALGGLALLWVFRNVGRDRNELHKVALSSGLVASLMPMGFFGQIGTGIGIVPVIAFDSLALLFLHHLWTRATVLTNPYAKLIDQKGIGEPNLQWISIRLTLPWGLLLGIIAGSVITTGFNPVVILAFVGVAAMRGIVIYLLYVASKRELYPSNPLPVMSIALIAGFAITFVGSILVGPTPIFQTLAVIAIIDAPVYIAYRMIQFVKARRELSVPVRNLVRNIFVVLFVVMPLLLFLSISYWTMLLVILNLIVFFSYFRDGRKTGNMATPS